MHHHPGPTHQPSGRRILAMLGLLTGMALAAWPAANSHAQGLKHPDQGKLTATGGVSTVEGAGGGGLVPWALIAGYGSRDSFGGNAHLTQARSDDYSLGVAGAAFGWRDRVELSYARQDFRGIAGALNRTRIEQDVFGAKLRLAGDAVYDQDSWMPQIALGVQHKRNRGIRGLEALGVARATDLGARSNTGTDVYLAATKLYLAQSLLANATLRFTKANQFGLLGFGGDRGDSHKARLEASLAYLVTPKLVVGAEYRMKPRNLAVDDEASAADIFVAWFPSKNVSVTLAWVELGTIVKPFNPDRQRAAYVSLQAGF